MTGMKIGALLWWLLVGYVIVTWIGIGWVLIPHPLQLTFKQFYVEYQPWITLINIAIFLGPVIGYFIAR
jgi:hypothetical protein